MHFSISEPCMCLSLLKKYFPTFQSGNSTLYYLLTKQKIVTNRKLYLEIAQKDTIGMGSPVAQTVICLQCRRPGFDAWVRKIPWRRPWQLLPAFFSGEFPGQRSLAGYSPWGHKELDMTEPLTLSLSYHRYFILFFHV